MDTTFTKLNTEQQKEAEALAKRELSHNERQFTSTGDKISRHTELVQSLREKRPYIISAHIMPTDICNLECSFCSVADRNAPYREVTKKVSQNESLSETDSEVYKRPPFLDLESEIKPAVTTLKKWGLKAVILSGGGEPTFYKDKNGKKFTDLVEYLSGENLEVALITNGTRLAELSQDVRDRLTWIRVSWYPFEYPEKYNPEYNIPIPGKSTTLGYSMVVTNKPSAKLKEPLRGENLFDFYADAVSMVNKHGLERNAEYLRLVPDCHVHGDEHLGLHEVAKKLEKTIGGIVLYQQKFHRPPEKCFMGYVRPVVYANGLVFPCDSLILNDGADRRFHPRYAMTDITHLDSFLQDSVGKLNSLISDTYSMCPKCVFFENNRILGQYVKGEGKDPVNGDVTGIDLKHKNFI